MSAWKQFRRVDLITTRKSILRPSNHIKSYRLKSLELYIKHKNSMFCLPFQTALWRPKNMDKSLSSQGSDQTPSVLASWCGPMNPNRSLGRFPDERNDSRVMWNRPCNGEKHDGETKRSRKHHESINKDNQILHFAAQQKKQNLRTVLKTRLESRDGPDLPGAPAFKEFTCASVFFICFIIAMSCHNSMRKPDSNSGMNCALAWFKYGTASQPQKSHKTQHQKPGPCPLTRFL